MPQKLAIYQSLWAMERRRPDGLEWPLDEQLEMISRAGFDGAGVRFDNAGGKAGSLRVPKRSEFCFDFGIYLNADD